MDARAERGVFRVLDKLDISIKECRYYEAHQMYRSIYYRYLTKKKYGDLLDLLFRGATILLEHNEHGSGIDLAILLIDVLAKSEIKPNEEWIDKIITLFKSMHSSVPEREIFITNVVNWSMDENMKGHPLLHKKFGEVFWEKKELVLALKHGLHSNDGVTYAKMLIDLQTTRGRKSEVDLFITQAVLRILGLRNKQMANEVLNEYARSHPMILNEKGPPYSYPLLNFLWILLKAIEKNDALLFIKARRRYAKSLRRDPLYSAYLNKIAKVWFRIKKRKYRILKSKLDCILNSIISVEGNSEIIREKIQNSNIPELD
ncbi:unnamed protein product [Leptidea sinapis]|uniref:Uncharacterized protein n=2 Tax=Leptidea sinapis TaxID=189913 RepID=A0A5E4PQK5_9NEOP|nr:unnamed protein product [Leptidea sinapis]